MRYIILLSLALMVAIEAKPYQNLFKEHPDTPRSSIEGIDAIYVINLDFRPERWHRLEPILHYHGIDASRFSAVCGWDFSNDVLKEYCAKQLTPNKMGCMLSHLSIYQDALNRGLDCIWVMEDDVEVCRDPHLLTEFIKEIDAIDPEWDILYTDPDFIKEDGTYIFSRMLPKETAEPLPYSLRYYCSRPRVSPRLQVIRSRYGTTSMIVSKRGMQKVLKRFTEGESIMWPIDLEIHYVPNIRQYGITDAVVTNAHFSFNHSDPGSNGIRRGYYEITEENVCMIKEQNKRLKDLLVNWPACLDR